MFVLGFRAEFLSGFRALLFYVSGISGIGLLCFRGFRHRAFMFQGFQA